MFNNQNKKMGLLFIYGAVSIFFSFLCSILEAVLLSVTPTFINVKKKEGKAYAETLEEFKKDVDRPLIAILTLNTIAHTVGAILVGGEAEKHYEGDGSGVFMVSAIMTILILVASEIIPKTIGATYWKSLAGFTASALNILIFPLKWTGILWVLQLTTKLVGKSAHGSVLSRQDFAVMTEMGEKEGTLKNSESRIINNLLQFDSITAKDIMTPRTVVVAVPETMTLIEYYEKYPNLRFSRIPVFHDTNDNVTGVFLKDELLLNLAKGNKEMTVGSLASPIEMVRENVPLSKIFNLFLEKRIHIALVIGEYGGMHGVVSMEDVLETLLGLEIMDESDNAEDMQHLARQKWKERAKKLGLVDGENED
jgi:CBS domain containing-hemolysin-like protein